MKKVIKSANPFLENIEVPVLRLFQSTSMYKDSEGGNSLTYEEHSRSYHVEKTEHCKLYLQADLSKILFEDMTSAGVYVFNYIQINLKKDKDYIQMIGKDVCETIKVSRVTLNKGLRQLESARIICKKSQSEYWINPRYFFNGNRLNYLSKEGIEFDVVASINKK